MQQFYQVYKIIGTIFEMGTYLHEYHGHTREWLQKFTYDFLLNLSAEGPVAVGNVWAISMNKVK